MRVGLFYCPVCSIKIHLSDQKIRRWNRGTRQQIWFVLCSCGAKLQWFPGSFSTVDSIPPPSKSGRTRGPNSRTTYREERRKLKEAKREAQRKEQESFDILNLEHRGPQESQVQPCGSSFVPIPKPPKESILFQSVKSYVRGYLKSLPSREALILGTERMKQIWSQEDSDDSTIQV